MARSTKSSIGRTASADSICLKRARVSGCRGVNSVQQSWSGMIEMGYEPSRWASAVISSLSNPMSGLSTGSDTTPPMTDITFAV